MFMFIVIKFTAMVKSKICDVDLAFCIILMFIFALDIFMFAMLFCEEKKNNKKCYSDAIAIFHFLAYVIFMGMLVCNFFETSMEKSFGLKEKKTILALFELIGYTCFLFAMYTFFAMCHCKIDRKDFLGRIID